MIWWDNEDAEDDDVDDDVDDDAGVDDGEEGDGDGDGDYCDCHYIALYYDFTILWWLWWWKMCSINNMQHA